MIFRPTRKLAKKVKLQSLKALPNNQNLFIDWSADLFTAERARYIITTNTASLYSPTNLAGLCGFANDQNPMDERIESVCRKGKEQI